MKKIAAHGPPKLRVISAIAATVAMGAAALGFATEGQIAPATTGLADAAGTQALPPDNLRKPVGLTITQGNDLPICKVYAMRIAKLNDAFCSRPEDDSIPGFERLDRYELTEAEAIRHYSAVRHFVDGAVAVSSPTTIEFFGSWAHAWSFRTPVDVENDGKPLFVLVWQGMPATNKGGACGGLYASKPWDFPYIETRDFILAADGRAIDEARTRAIFGYQDATIESCVNT